MAEAKPASWFRKLDPEVEKYMPQKEVDAIDARVEQALKLQDQLRGLKANDPKYAEIAQKLKAMGQPVSDSPKQVLWNDRVTHQFKVKPDPQTHLPNQ